MNQSQTILHNESGNFYNNDLKNHTTYGLWLNESPWKSVLLVLHSECMTTEL